MELIFDHAHPVRTVVVVPRIWVVAAAKTGIELEQGNPCFCQSPFPVINPTGKDKKCTSALTRDDGLSRPYYVKRNVEM